MYTLGIYFVSVSTNETIKRGSWHIFQIILSLEIVNQYYQQLDFGSF